MTVPKDPVQLTRAVEHSTGVIVFSLDKNYCYTSFSESHRIVIKKIWGVTIEEGLCMLNFLPEPDRSKAKANFDRALAGEHFTQIEEYGDEKLQRSFWEDRYDPIYDETGQVDGVVVFVLDVTERMRSIRKIEELESRLSLAMEAGQIGVWEWKIETQKVYWSPNIYTMVGIAPEDFDGSFEQYLKIIHPDDRTHLLQALEQTMEQNQPYATEHRALGNNGSVRWFSGRGEVIRDAAGAPVRMLGTVQDITNQKNAQLASRDWQVRYDLIVDSSQQIIYDYHVASGNIIWGGNTKAVLDFETHEMGGLDQWVEMIHPDDRAKTLAALEHAKATERKFDVSYRFQTRSGRYVTVQDRGFFVANEHGEIGRMLGVMEDITEQELTAHQLRESELRYRTLQEASFGGIGIHDQGIILECNQGLSDITGYSRDELIGMNGLLLCAPEYHNLIREKINMQDSQPYDAEGIRKDGSRYFLEIHGKSIPYQGKVVRVTEFRDITARKLTEQKISEQNARLVAIADDLKNKNEQLEEFTQIVSHNLRSPITNSLTLLDFYDSTLDETERATFIKMLRDSVSKMFSNLTELNEVLKIKQNKNIERQRLRFDTQLDEVSKMLNAKIVESGAVIQADFDVPEITYPAIYLESILLNLISNAIKYRHPQRKPVIHLLTRQSGKNVVLEVVDNGLGINLKRYGHHVFKLRKTFHDHPDSRGIGLFLVKNQIETLGGSIALSSEEGKGSVFTITFAA
ncbi:MAG: PAS domain-containing protein [Cyclobacteriaceae bacterium]|jgi:PAS domain S-box-containing protein|nr:PAS domain-containing protein [Cyclobacteriaceae bacterium]